MSNFKRTKVVERVAVQFIDVVIVALILFNISKVLVLL